MKLKDAEIRGPFMITHSLAGIDVPKNWDIIGYVTNYGDLYSINSSLNYISREELKIMVRNHERKEKLKKLSNNSL